MCEHLQPFAAMALVPLLLWIHHFETYPTAWSRAVDGLDGVLLHDVEDDAPTDALEGRWAA